MVTYSFTNIERLCTQEKTSYHRQPLAFLVDLCSFYTALEVEKVRTVNYIFGLIAPRSNARGNVVLPIKELHSVAQNKVWHYLNHPLINSTYTNKIWKKNHEAEPGGCRTFNSQTFRPFLMIVYTVNYIVTILRMLMTWRRNEGGHHLL